MNKLVSSANSVLSSYKGIRGLLESTNPSSFIALPRNSQPIVSGLGTETPDTEKPNPDVQVAEKAASFTQVGRGLRNHRRKASTK